MAGPPEDPGHHRGPGPSWGHGSWGSASTCSSSCTSWHSADTVPLHKSSWSNSGNSSWLPPHNPGDASWPSTGPSSWIPSNPEDTSWNNPGSSSWFPSNNPEDAPWSLPVEVLPKSNWPNQSRLNDTNGYENINTSRPKTACISSSRETASFVQSAKERRASVMAALLNIKEPSNSGSSNRNSSSRNNNKRSNRNSSNKSCHNNISLTRHFSSHEIAKNTNSGHPRQPSMVRSISAAADAGHSIDTAAFYRYYEDSVLSSPSIFSQDNQRLHQEDNSGGRVCGNLVGGPLTSLALALPSKLEGLLKLFAQSLHLVLAAMCTRFVTAYLNLTKNKKKLFLRKLLILNLIGNSVSQ